MREIRDRVERDWAKAMMQRKAIRESVDVGSLIDVLLVHPDVAIVDREAELPTAYGEGMSQIAKTGYRMAQTEILKAGWVKEVKNV